MVPNGLRWIAVRIKEHACALLAARRMARDGSRSGAFGFDWASRIG